MINNNYKIIFSDIDGTLIDSQRKISEKTKQKIKKICSSGVKFILVSARMPTGIYAIEEELEINSPIACYSGALILDENKNVLKSECIYSEDIVNIKSFVDQNYQNMAFNAYYMDDWFIDTLENDFIKQRIKTTLWRTEGLKVQNIANLKKVNRLLAISYEEQILKIEQDLQKNFPHLQICRSLDTCLEIMPSDASKSNAVRFLSKKYNIPLNNTVSFGDNYNDLDMLELTGQSFAMGNAPDYIKSKAKNVTLDNDHEGVLDGLIELGF
jgi:Cof subfamily protein (haloacid dehalogenase superfamily)